jgi:hypothetical protein
VPSLLQCVGGVGGSPGVLLGGAGKRRTRPGDWERARRSSEPGAGKIGADHAQQKGPGPLEARQETPRESAHSATSATPSAVVQASAEEIASRYPGVELPPKWRAVAGGDLRFLEILYKLKSMPLKPVQKGKWPPSKREELSRLVVCVYVVLAAECCC